MIYSAASCLLPSFLSSLSAEPRRLLLYSFFKVGPLAITPLFLLKAALFLVLLTAISHWLQKWVLSRLLTHLHVSDAQRFALGRFATYFLFLGGLFVGMQSLGVNLNSLVIFGGAVGVGVGLGLQNVVSNFVAGLILLIEQPIRIGDRVETEKLLGDVVKIAARSTWIRTNDNFIIIVPNNEFINNPVTNWTANDPNVRVLLPVGVGYNCNPEKVRDLLLAAAHAHPDVLKEPAPDVIFTDYGDNSINFSLRIWTATKAHMPTVLKSDLISLCSRRSANRASNCPFRSAICTSARLTLRCLSGVWLPAQRRRTHPSSGVCAVNGVSRPLWLLVLNGRW